MKLKTKCYYCGKDITIFIPRRNATNLTSQFMGYSCNDCVDEDSFARDGINESMYTEIKKPRYKDLLYINYPIEVHVDESFRDDHTAIAIFTPVFDRDMKDSGRQMAHVHLFRRGTLTNNSSIKNKAINKRSCYHHYIPIANSHGELINHVNGRTYIVCVKCGKGLWIENYFDAPYGYSYSGWHHKTPPEPNAEKTIYKVTKKVGAHR